MLIQTRVRFKQYHIFDRTIEDGEEVNIDQSLNTCDL